MDCKTPAGNPSCPSENTRRTLPRKPRRAKEYRGNEYLFKILLNIDAFVSKNVPLQSLSEQLGVSARTLSTLVNAKYEAPFRDVVNSYRIDASKKYMHEHPEATQAEIACECGFKDSSAFNKKFKEMEGITPAMWIARAAASGFNGKRDTSDTQKQ